MTHGPDLGIATRFLNDLQFQVPVCRLFVKRIHDRIRGGKSEAVGE